MATARVDHSAATLADGRVLLVGGSDDGRHSFTALGPQSLAQITFDGAPR